jgi:hypothetical protein
MVYPETSIQHPAGATDRHPDSRLCAGLAASFDMISGGRVFRLADRSRHTPPLISTPSFAA